MFHNSVCAGILKFNEDQNLNEKRLGLKIPSVCLIVPMMFSFDFRNELVSVDDQYTYKDVQDVFEREPYIVRFSAPFAGK